MENMDQELTNKVLTIIDKAKEHLNSQEYLDLMSFWSKSHSQNGVRKLPNGFDLINVEYGASLSVRKYGDGTNMKLTTEIGDFCFVDGRLESFSLNEETDPHEAFNLMATPRMSLSWRT